nr:HupE/UreJ family protein [uncultured Arsenicibacter sp.]
MAAINQTTKQHRKVFFRCLLLLGLLANNVTGHPMPNSMVLLNVHPASVEAELQMPLVELQAAIGHGVNDRSDNLIQRLGPLLKTYLMQHIRPATLDHRPWQVFVGELRVEQTQTPVSGTYKELLAQVTLVPPAGATTRQFIFNYDAIIHQVVTHRILVSVAQDWERGITTGQPPVGLGVIDLDIETEKVKPFVVRLQSGSWWTGFVAMFTLGREHIAEGTDHLLFLLVLLLPAPLLYDKRRWLAFGGVRFALKRLLLIVTAFTAGHSLTLLAGALGWVAIPAQPIEVLIAVSILVSAVHAIKPVFAGREAWIAGGFGLIHGLAFANTMLDLQLDPTRLVLSILGFNLGIECMQLAIIAVTIPWLMLLSRTRYYSVFRLTGASLASIAALAWVAERISGESNIIADYLTRL